MINTKKGKYYVKFIKKNDNKDKNEDKFTININHIIKKIVEDNKNSKNRKESCGIKRTKTFNQNKNTNYFPVKGFYSRNLKTEENDVAIINKRKIEKELTREKTQNNQIKKTNSNNNKKITKNKKDNLYQTKIGQCSKVSKNLIFKTQLKYSDLWELINISKNRILTIENQKNQNIIFPPQKTLPDPVSSISRNKETQIKQVPQINLRKTINYGQVKQNEETPLTKKDKIVSYYINKKNDLLYSVLGDEMQKLTNKIYINTESNINDY